jgi:multidrug resistance efflux pump
MASPSAGKGIIMDKRIIELALETLERRIAAIVTEIAELESQMRGQPKRTPEKPAAARQSQSERMKAYWVRKRSLAAKAQATKKPKSGPQSEAARKAVSKRMKAYWKKRKAMEAKAGKKSA